MNAILKYLEVSTSPPLPATPRLLARLKSTVAALVALAKAGALTRQRLLSVVSNRRTGGDASAARKKGETP
jgi:hypothetical protein